MDTPSVAMDTAETPPGKSRCTCVHGSVPLYFFISLSLLLYLAEIALICCSASHLYLLGEFVWFALTVGFLIVPLIGSQLLSLQLMTGSITSSNASTGSSISSMQSKHVVIHALLSSIPWRYLALVMSNTFTMTKWEIRQMYIVRLFHTFASTLPLLLLHTYLVFSRQPSGEPFHLQWQFFATAVTLAASVSWTIATHRKNWDFCCVVGAVLPYSTIACKFIWRLGEVTCRVSTLALFATCHSYWIFLVLGLHELTMVLLIIMDHALKSADKWKPNNQPWKVALVACMYIFCHLNLSSNNSKNEFALFHVIMTMETITLVLLWVIYDVNTHFHLVLLLFVAVSYVMSAVAGIFYYTYFYRQVIQSASPTEDGICLFQCLRCKFRSQGKRNLHLQPPHHATLVHIQDNPNPKYFDLLDPADQEVNGPDFNIDHNQVPFDLDHKVPQAHRVHYDAIPSAPRPSLAADELDWDNYDLEVASNPGNCFDIDINDPLQMTGGCLDQGYHSANSSSKENALQVAKEILALGAKNLPPEEDNASTITSISSRMNFFNCNNCGHNMSVDSSSVYSTSTMASSSQFGKSSGSSAYRPTDRMRQLRAQSFSYGRPKSRLSELDRNRLRCSLGPAAMSQEL